jgi:succinate dehydrogenase/fumarate reductase iron-sulfur protein
MMPGLLNICKFNPQTDTRPHFASYRFDWIPGMTVLDALKQIHEDGDSAPAFSYGCRNGHCGVCAMLIDSRPALACRCPAKREMRLEPLPGFPVSRDLIIDREQYEGRRSGLRLFLERGRVAAEEPEFIDPIAFADFKTASRCVECHCCVSACPVYRREPHAFAGPTALILEARHFFDPRDDLNREAILRSCGIESCLACGRCTEVCELGVGPDEIIKKIRMKLGRSKEIP